MFTPTFRRHTLAAALITSSVMAVKRSSTIARKVSALPEGLYFRQLTPGKDIALSDSHAHQFARQMNNFIYVIGDKEKGIAAVIDGAWDPDGIQDLVQSDNLTLSVCVCIVDMVF